jgi:hypothetical protein
MENHFTESGEIIFSALSLLMYFRELLHSEKNRFSSWKVILFKNKLHAALPNAPDLRSLHSTSGRPRG